MRKYFLRIGGICIWLACTMFTLAFTPIKNEKTIIDFTLRNVDGKLISLSNYPDAKGFIVVFTCNHCPFAKLYPERMNVLNTKYRQLGVPLIAISSTDTSVYEDDGFDKMVEKAQAEHFNYPYLYDPEQLAAKKFGAQRTPHAFVIWKEKGGLLIKYNGAIDDNGAEPEKATHHYIAEAVDSLLRGGDVDVRVTKSIGCQIHFRR